jgi:hypothetical protein
MLQVKDEFQLALLLHYFRQNAMAEVPASNGCTWPPTDGRKTYPEPEPAVNSQRTSVSTRPATACQLGRSRPNGTATGT